MYINVIIRWRENSLKGFYSIKKDKVRIFPMTDTVQPFSFCVHMTFMNHFYTKSCFLTTANRRNTRKFVTANRWKWLCWALVELRSKKISWSEWWKKVLFNRSRTWYSCRIKTKKEITSLCMKSKWKQLLFLFNIWFLIWNYRT